MRNLDQGLRDAAVRVQALGILRERLRAVLKDWGDEVKRMTNELDAESSPDDNRADNSPEVDYDRKACALNANAMALGLFLEIVEEQDRSLADHYTKLQDRMRLVKAD